MKLQLPEWSSLWDPIAISKVEQCYSDLSDSSSGYISGNQVVMFLQKTSLEKLQLREIWEIASKHSNAPAGHLDSNGFRRFLARRFVLFINVVHIGSRNSHVGFRSLR